MSTLARRALDFFIEPAAAPTPTAPSRAWAHPAPEPVPPMAAAGWTPRVSETAPPPAAAGNRPATGCLDAAGWVPPVPEIVPPADAAAHRPPAKLGVRPLHPAGWAPPLPRTVPPAAAAAGAPPAAAAAVAGVVGCAAVLGRPGEAEPVAAALALALRRRARARAAVVAVVASSPAERSATGGSATGAARRLADRLTAHGFEAAARGRLAWVRTGVDAAARVAAAGAGEPVVLAVTAPRTAAVETVLAMQDLVVIVAADPCGPLALLAGDAPHVPAVTVRPLARGPARSLARAGLGSARAVTEIAAAAAGGGER